MIRPGIEPRSPEPLANTQFIYFKFIQVYIYLINGQKAIYSFLSATKKTAHIKMPDKNIGRVNPNPIFSGFNYLTEIRSVKWFSAKKKKKKIKKTANKKFCLIPVLF